MPSPYGPPEPEDDVSPEALDDLLAEMRELRLTLAADLSTAAGATDAGAPEIAADIIEADRGELARFARVADERLRRLPADRDDRTPATAWRRRFAVTLPAIPAVGAIALTAAAAGGVLPIPGSGGGSTAPGAAAHASATATPVDSTFRRFVNVIDGNPSASQVIAAASKLHRQIRKLIASSPADPSRAAAVAELLRMEQSLLMRERPPGAGVVLDATRRLAARLSTAAPKTTPSISPSWVPSLPPSHRPHREQRPDAPAPTASPTAEPSKPAPAPNPTQSPSPAPSESPSESPSGYPPLPALP